MVILVRNYIVRLDIDTLYYIRFLIGGAFNPFIVPPYRAIVIIAKPYT